MDCLGVAFGLARRGHSGNLVIGEAPGEWLVLGPSGHEHAILADLEATAAGSFSTMLEMTHGYAVVRLTGNEVGAVLSKLSPVDLSRACRSERHCCADVACWHDRGCCPRRRR